MRFFYQYHTIQSQNGQEKRKIKGRRIVYSVKKVTMIEWTICEKYTKTTRENC